MSVFLPLAIIPSSFIYYYYFLPELINLNFIVVGYISSMLGIFKNWLINIKNFVINTTNIELNYLQELWLEFNGKKFFIIILNIGEYLGSHFRFMNIAPGSLLVKFSEYMLSEYGYYTGPKSASIKTFLNKT
jgi:hypothetical protein